MKRRYIILMAALVVGTSALAQQPGGQVATGLPMAKTDWHGFDRYDFVLDSASGEITPFTPPTGEGTGVGEPAKGLRRCILIVPKQAAVGHPWSWRGCYWDYQPQTEIALLQRGFCIAYISAGATLPPDKTWEIWYAFLTDKYDLSSKPVFIGMSRGGSFAYRWATTHPDAVSCIYADNPAIDPDALMKLGALAARDVPLLNICGSMDPLLGYHTLAIEGLYQQMGGRISVMIKEGMGHHPHSLRDVRPIADWIEQNYKTVASGLPASAAYPGVPPAGNPPMRAPPSLVGDKYTHTDYYGTENHYAYSLSEGTYITCRGPWFSGCYDRYVFNVPGIDGAVTLTLPQTSAPGNPWVFRAGFAGREAMVDLALLAKGYVIVTGPVSYNSDSLSLKDWNAVYRLMTDHGYATKVVLEGAGGAAGQIYGWAVANPDKIACIYAENPFLRSTFSGAIPGIDHPIDHLAVLAQARVPILHVCGSLDPALTDQTLSEEKRYKALGGSIRVILREGQGHYPLGPADVTQAVDFITRSTPAPLVRDYRFDGRITRNVLDNYLSRSITIEGLLNGRGDLDDNIRMIRNTGAKFVGRSICLWGGEDRLISNLQRAAEEMPRVRAGDPDLILEACIFEIVTTQAEEVPVPDWAFKALGMPAEDRHFRYADMLYPDGTRKDQWGPGASVPDVSRPETQLWFYFLAKSYIDLGFEAIHFGQVEIMNGNDPDLSNWSRVFSLVRAYAAGHARRHMVLLDAHVPSGGLVRDGHLLLDFHAFPLRIKEVPDRPQEAILQLGFSDGLYNRSKGGITPSGWSCTHLPYLVEFDNYGVSKGPGQSGQGHGGFDWIWGYDEITWFALQPKDYRDQWLAYAWRWVRQTDTNAWLEMPGGRTMSSPLDHRRWYYGNIPSAATPEGLDVATEIKAIWAQDKGASANGLMAAAGANALSAPVGANRPPAISLTFRSGQLLAGTAKVNLTPAGDEPLHDSIYARSLVLQAGGLRLAFVSVDLAVFTSQRVEDVCKSEFGITQLMICSSHNHSEPQQIGGRSFEKGNPYSRFYEDQIIKAVGLAVSGLFPARIAAGHRSFPQLGFNRLIARDDGHARESWFGDAHYTSENPERIPFGPVDPEVGVIRIEDMQGEARAILMNYACHADVVCFNYAISADYPGVACRKVEEAFDNKVNCLFIQGAGGNVEPLMISSRRTGPNDAFQTDYRPMERTGELLAWETIRLAKDLRPEERNGTDIRMLEDSLQLTGRFDKALRFNVHLSTILIDSTIVIAACPGELFSTLQLDWDKKILEASGNPFLFGYTWSGGGWPGYVADVRSAALGGYGADQDPGIIEVGAGENIMVRQLENYYRLTGLMRTSMGPVGFSPGNRWVITPVPPGKP